MDFIDIGLISSYALIGLCTLAAILIITTYTFFFLAITGIIYTEISKIFS